MSHTQNESAKECSCERPRAHAQENENNGASVKKRACTPARERRIVKESVDACVGEREGGACVGVRERGVSLFEQVRVFMCAFACVGERDWETKK